jgi:hypothetical protein
LAGFQSKSTIRRMNRKILEFWHLQTPRRREKFGRYISYVGERGKNSRSTENVRLDV